MLMVLSMTCPGRSASLAMRPPARRTRSRGVQQVNDLPTLPGITLVGLKNRNDHHPWLPPNPRRKASQPHRPTKSQSAKTDPFFVLRIALPTGKRTPI